MLVLVCAYLVGERVRRKVLIESLVYYQLLQHLLLILVLSRPDLKSHQSYRLGFLENPVFAQLHQVVLLLSFQPSFQLSLKLTLQLSLLPLKHH